MKQYMMDQVADWVLTLKNEDLDDETIHYAKRFLLDSLGCMLGGSKTSDIAVLKKALLALGGREDARVIGSGEKLPLPYACLVNGVALRALEFCDIYAGNNPSHPSEFGIPAALCVCDMKKTSGRDLLMAIVLGYELQIRMADACASLMKKGWGSSATLGIFTTPFVVGKILGFNREQLIHAANISGTKPTLGKFTVGRGSMMKTMVNPLTAQQGALAALLAQNGITGPEDMMEGPKGYIHKVVDDEFDADVYLSDFGKPFRIRNSGFRLYPSNSLAHPATTAAIEVAKANDFDADNIKEVRVATFELGKNTCAGPDKYVFETKEAAQFSLPYGVAAGLIYKQLTLAEFEPAVFKSQAVIDLAQKVIVTTNDEINAVYPQKRQAFIEVELNDGRVFKTSVDYPKGSPENPVTDAELEEKFRSIVPLSREKADALIEMIWAVDQLDDITPLMDALVIE